MRNYTFARYTREKLTQQLMFQQKLDSHFFVPCYKTWWHFRFALSPLWRKFVGHLSLTLAASVLLTFTPPQASAQTSSSALINHWTPGASLSAARSQACASLLSDGRLLVAGGLGDSGPVATVDVYGTDGSFSAGPAMAQARAQASCTTLADGRVLVAGGDGGAGPLVTAEIFDPASTSWTPTGSLSVAREGHQAVMMPSGVVFIVGGAGAGGIVGALETYLNGQFRAIGILNTPRMASAIVPLGVGKVLIAGGSDGANALNSVEMYDGGMGGGLTVAGSISQARKNFSAVALLDGTVLMTGGFDSTGNLLGTTEIFDPRKGTATPGPALLQPRANHTAYALPNNGSVVVYGGMGAAGTLSSSEVFTFATGGIGFGSPLSTDRTGDAKAILRPGSLLVAGGRSSSGFLTSSELFRFSTIATDQGDYAPGTAVRISGGGWVPGEQVSVQITAFPVDEHHIEFTASAIADGAGAIVVPGFKVDQSHLHMKFLMTAAGSQSLAQDTFTDGVDPTVTWSFNPAQATPPAAPSAVDVTLTLSGASGTPTGNVEICSQSTGCPLPGVTPDAGYNCVNNLCPLDANGLFKFTYTVPAGTTVFQVVYFGDSNYSTVAQGAAGTTASYRARNATTTSFTSGPTGNTPYGSQTPYSVNVSGTGTLTGAVTFLATGVNIAGCTSLPLTGSSSRVSCIPNPPLAVSTAPYVMTAQYSGDSNNAASTTGSSISTTIAPGATALTTPTAAPQPVAFGQTVTFTGTVSPVGSSIAPTGSMQFCMYNSLRVQVNCSGSIALTPNSPASGSSQGQYSLATTVIGAGAFTVQTSYTNADGNFTNFGPSSSGSFTVSQAPAIFTISSSDATLNQQVPVTSAVTFTATYAGGITPAATGTITFINTAAGNAVICGPVALTNGVASCSAAAGPNGAAGLAVGPVTAGVLFGADANYTLAVPATTNTFTFSVVKAKTTTTLIAASSDSPSATFLGHTVTLTATVTATNATVQPTFADLTITPPTGNSSGSTCAAPSAGSTTATSIMATCTFVVTGPLGTGTINANAAYAGDTQTLASATAGPGTPITIKDAATQTVLTATSADMPGATFIGHTVTLTAVVSTTTPKSALAPSFANITITPPAGNSSGSTCGAPTAGATTSISVTARCTFVVTGPLGTGTINATAAYAADNNVGTAASATASPGRPFTIQLAATSTVLTATSDNSPNPNSPLPTELGRTVTLKAVVTTTTAGAALQPKASAIGITPPAGNSSNSTCLTPTAGAITASSVTVSCTFVLTGTPTGGNPASLNASASYAGDNATGTAANGPTVAAIPTTKATTVTSLTAATTSLTDPNTAVQLGRTVTLTAVASTLHNGTGVLTGPAGSFTFTLPANTYLAAACGTQVSNAFTSTSTTVTVPAYNTGGGNLGMAMATCTFTVVPPSAGAAVGMNSYSAVYNGDSATLSTVGSAGIAAQANTTQITTVLDTTTISACSSTSGACAVKTLPTYVYGQTFTLNAVLTNSTGLAADGAPYQPTRFITFSGNGVTYIEPIIANSTGGTASVTSPTGVPIIPPAGAYTLSVNYPTQGVDPYYAPSSTSVAFVVNKATTVTTVTPLPTNLAGVLNLRVSVSAVAPGSGIPTGTVQALLGTSLAATATLGPGSGASCAPNASPCATALFTLASGSYSATYAGDSNFFSTTLSGQTGGSAGTGTTTVASTAIITISATPDSAQPGQTVALTAIVNELNGQPSGSVQFTDNGVIVAVAPLVAGVATYIDTSLTPGPHTIGAIYNGNATFPGASTNIDVTVTSPTPTTSFSSNPTASVFGQQVTVTVTFTSPTQGGSSPAGAVQFLDNGNAICSPVTIVNGVATLTLGGSQSCAALPPGVNSIGVQYSSNNSFSNLTKNVGTITVSQAQTTATLMSAASGNQMTLTATVAVVSPGAGSPTGTVIFIDTVTGQTFGAFDLVNGVATTTIPITGDSIVAIYSGDTNFLTATSTSTAPVTVTPLNAASDIAAFSPDAIVSLYGAGLGTQTLSGALPLSTSLAGITVTVTDSAGVPRQGLLFFVSPGQINFLIPAGTATGMATITVSTPNGSFTAAINVTASTSALFTANNSGSGPLAAQVVTVAPGGQETYANTASSSGAAFVTASMSLSPPANTFYLLLYGTGFDNAHTVTVTINGQSFTPSYFGPQGGFAGLDQINILLPVSLAGAGQVNVSITVDGQVSNVGTIAFAGAGTN